MRILIVDDKIENLLLLDTLLRGFGYQVEQAANGQEALEKLETNSFQMIISDILMPVMDGYELCRKCKSDPSLQNIIFIFYTATYTTQEDEEYALQLGADQFLIKPMDPGDFLTTIRDIAQKAEVEEVSKKEPAILGLDAVMKHRDLLFHKLDKKIVELKTEIQERERTEKKYHNLMEFSPGAVIVYREGEIVYLNKSGCKLLGSETAEKLIGKDLLDFIHPDFRDIAAERIQNILSGNTKAPQTFEEKLVNVTGKAIDIEGTALPIIYENKPAVQILICDISERKDAEKALRKTETQQSIAMKIAKLGYWEYDVSNDLFTLNANIYTIFGTSLAETGSYKMSSSQYIKKFVHPDDYDFVKNEIKKAAETLDTNFSDSIEHRIKYKDGKIGHIAAHFFIETNENRRVQKIFGAIQDISERKTIEEQIKNNLQEKEILLRELYHRTKNNMQVISSMLRIHARQVDDEETKNIFYDIENKILSMSIVHQKLLESKDLSHLDLLEYCQDMIEFFKQSYLYNASQVDFSVTGDSIKILIDTAVPIGLILTELVINALKHAFPDNRKGKIEVNILLTPKRELTIQVSDNGVGFPENFNIDKNSRWGLQSVTSLVEHQLNGTIEFKNSQGVQCFINLKKELYEPRV